MSSFPNDWYWAADDGRVFSSARQAVVAQDDAGLADFKATGAFPTPWPRDDAGQQTDAALQDVLTPYGLSVSPVRALVIYAKNKQWTLATGGYTAKVTGGTFLVPTDDQSRSLVLSIVVRLGQANPPASIDYPQADGSFATLSGADFLAAAIAASDFFLSTVSALKKVIADITAGKVTTAAQVDAASWPAAQASAS